VWWFVIGVVGSSITTNRWLLDTAVFTHLTPVPAGSIDWMPVLVMTGIGVVGALAGMVAFSHRDLAAA
jgi:ABC-2 type transport system permease protein